MFKMYNDSITRYSILMQTKRTLSKINHSPFNENEILAIENRDSLIAIELLLRLVEMIENKKYETLNELIWLKFIVVNVYVFYKYYEKTVDVIFYDLYDPATIEVLKDRRKISMVEFNIKNVSIIESDGKEFSFLEIIQSMIKEYARKKDLVLFDNVGETICSTPFEEYCFSALSLNHLHIFLCDYLLHPEYVYDLYELEY